MDLFAEFRALVTGILADMGAPPDRLEAVTLERPKSASHGEMSTNAAIVAARLLGRKPTELAAGLAAELRRDNRVSEAVVAGPGFLNFRLAPASWISVSRQAIAAGSDFGRTAAGSGRVVNLEFVSANPTGPLHVGHARGAVFGDALGRLLEFTGYEVVREYYVNDGGAQVDALGRSVFLRYLEANGQEIEFGSDEYRGDYLVETGQHLKDIHGDGLVGKPEPEWLEMVRELAIDAMMELVRRDLDLLGISMDLFFSERSLHDGGQVDDALAELDRRGLIYQGVLEPPKGNVPEDWEPRQQTLFKATAHGDDTDRPIRKSDGTWTYFASDIAYHYSKISRGYDELINVFGADHGGYVKRLKAVVSALSDGTMPLDIKLTQLVRVIDGDGSAKMSKRAGQFVELREAVDAVGPDVTRFVMLMRKNDAQLEFNFAEVTAQSRDNPVFYVQYAHARVCSVLRRAAAAGLPTDDDLLRASDPGCGHHPDQIVLARRVAEWPRVVEQAARHHEPHRIAFYLNDLASDFHAVWTRGNTVPELRFVDEDDREGSAARIALARSVGIVISCGLGILGVEPITEMRS